MLRFLSLAFLSAASLVACTGDIGLGDDSPPIDPAKDHVVAFRFASPIGVGQIGSNNVVDGCTVEFGCEQQDVQVMSVTIDRTDVVATRPTEDPARFDVTALAVGTANVSAVAHNTGIEASQAGAVQVLEPTRYDLNPVVPYSTPTGQVWLPRTCGSDPMRFETSVLASFTYRLYAEQTALLGSGFYPFQSARLDAVAPLDPGADGGMVRFSASAATGNSDITSLIGDDRPIRVINNYDSVVLSDQFKAPTGAQETLIWADVREDGEVVCFDAATRTLESETPDICTVVDARPQADQYTGPGPYRLNWTGTGNCRITFSVPNTGLSATRDYLPLP